MAQPCGIIVRKLYLQNNSALLGKGIPLPAASAKSDFRAVRNAICQLSVKGYSYLVFRSSFECLPHIPDKNHRPGPDTFHIQLELVDRVYIGGIILWRQRQARKQDRYVAIHNSCPAFVDNSIYPAFDFEKARIIRLIGITANAQLEAVFMSSQTFLAKLQIIRIQIKAHDRIVTTSL